METFSVDFPDGRGAPVSVGAGALALVASLAPRRVVVVSNPTVMSLHGDRLADILRQAEKEFIVAEVGDGERHKNMESLSRILDDMAGANIGRDGAVIAFGGGVVGDLGGFAAAVYMRGVAVIQAPTTLLAQVDAAIGGKTGINHRLGKNLIGAFHQPAATLCDTAVLSTLPDREYRAGLAEVVKYGLLGDAAFFRYLEENSAALLAREESIVAKIVGIAARGKAAIVGEDERETTGRRALLNLGHTFAHAAEAALGYNGRWLHGEAVGFGLAAAAALSEESEGFPAAETARVVGLLRALRLPVAPPPEVSDEALISAMATDKKRTFTGKRFVILRAIGDAALRPMDDAPARRALARLR